MGSERGGLSQRLSLFTKTSPRVRGDFPGCTGSTKFRPCLVQVNKFSKFGHGTAILHMDRCNVKPYWFDQMENRIESIYKPDEGSATLYREFRPPAQVCQSVLCHWTAWWTCPVQSADEKMLHIFACNEHTFAATEVR